MILHLHDLLVYSSINKLFRLQQNPILPLLYMRVRVISFLCHKEHILSKNIVKKYLCANHEINIFLYHVKVMCLSTALIYTKNIFLCFWSSIVTIIDQLILSISCIAHINVYGKYQIQLGIHSAHHTSFPHFKPVLPFDGNILGHDYIESIYRATFIMTSECPTYSL